MAFLMGIDLGTSSLKTIIIDEKGNNMALASRSYQYDAPISGYAEQNVDVWWQAAIETIKEVLAKSGIKGDEIKGVGFSGQMHGAVLLDEKNEVIRPVILHCDVRTGRQVENVKKLLGNRVRELMMNPVYTGFLLVSLLWVRDNEPENYKRIRKVCLPKDYIKYKLSGEITSDYSDASATLAFDIKNNKWSKEILDLVDVSYDIFPECYDTYSVVGHISKESAKLTGLSTKAAVVAGGGDQVMQGIGNGVTEIGQVTANIGSSGQICFQSDLPFVNPNLSTNTFCGYKKGRWIVQGAIMHAGLSLEWFNSLFETKDYQMSNKLAEEAVVGSDGLIFLPYLNGERTPHANPNLSAMLIGLNSKTRRSQMTRAVMEGVSFALYECMEVCENLGLSIGTVVASGGGARSPLWLQIQSDVYGLPLKVADNKEQACLGAAITAGVGAGIYKSTEDGCANVVRYKKEVIEPNVENHKKYMEYYALFKDAYLANEELLQKLTAMGRNL